jgi:vacuolar-type H+-ATPase subunit F/Vma7
MFDRVAIIGDADLVFAFRALGIKVFSPKDLEEARAAMELIEKENFALCFLQENLLESLEKEREALVQKFCPVVVGFSDYRKVTDYLQKMMREMAIKATGSDSLVRRGKNGTR